MNESQLLGAALAGMALLLFLIIRVRLHAFVALLLASLVIGVGAGMPLGRVLDSVTTGIGSTLGTIAVIVGLGAMLGRMLEVSGGAATLAEALVSRFGQHNAQWSLLIVGFVVAIPVFFDVAFWASSLAFPPRSSAARCTPTSSRRACPLRSRSTCEWMRPRPSVRCRRSEPSSRSSAFRWC
jgi:H+/gluconate symporter-like permease